MRNFIINFCGVIWFIYVLTAFVLGEFNFLNWSLEARFLVGFIICFVGISVSLAISIGDNENDSNL